MAARVTQVPFSAWPNFPTGLRVLLVDTDQNTRADAERLLLECSYLVTSCSTASEAISRIVDPASGYDILLVELKLFTSGDINLLRTLESARGAALILISDGAAPVELLQGVKQGAVDCIEKPLSPLKVRTLWQHKVRKMMAESRLSDTCASSAAHLASAGSGALQDPHVISSTPSNHHAPEMHHEGGDTPGSASAENDVVHMDSFTDAGVNQHSGEVTINSSFAGVQQGKADTFMLDTLSATSGTSTAAYDMKPCSIPPQPPGCSAPPQWTGPLFPMSNLANTMPWCMPFGAMPMPGPNAMMAGMLPSMMPFMRWPGPVLPGNAGMMPQFPPFGMSPMSCFPMGPQGAPDFMAASMMNSPYMSAAGGFPGMTPGMQVPMSAPMMVFPVQPPAQGSPAMLPGQQPQGMQPQHAQQPSLHQPRPPNLVAGADAGLHAPLGLQLKKTDSLLDLLADTLMNTTGGNTSV